MFDIIEIYQLESYDEQEVKGEIQDKEKKTSQLFGLLGPLGKPSQYHLTYPRFLPVV
jgi:hypothetical protein